MRTRSHFILALICCLAPMGAAQQNSNSEAWANQPQASPPPQSHPSQHPASPPIEVRALPAPPAPPQARGRIQLDVVVTDKKGNAVAGLARGDFTLLDNDRPMRMVSFRAYDGSAPAPDPPTNIVLAIDAVNVNFSDVSFSRSAVDQFLRQDGGRLAHPVTIVWLTDDGLEAQLGPSTDGIALAAQMDATEGRLRTLNRAAGAWGAIERFEMSAQMLDKMVKVIGKAPGRKLLIWVGPGWPMLDNPNMEITWKEQQHLFKNIVDFSTWMREGQVELYSVAEGMPDEFTFLYQAYLSGVKKPSQAYLPNLSLKVLAVESGGQVMAPSNDLKSEIDKCAEDAKAYYRIGFNPPRADGPDEYHELKVRVDRPGLAARTNTGYYNQP